MTERALEKLSMRLDSLEKGLSEMRLTYQDSVTNLKGSVRSQEELIRSLDRDRRAWVEYQAKASQSELQCNTDSILFLRIPLHRLKPLPKTPTIKRTLTVRSEMPHRLRLRIRLMYLRAAGSRW